MGNEILEIILNSNLAKIGLMPGCPSGYGGGLETLLTESTAVFGLRGSSPLPGAIIFSLIFSRN
jgi:hypothetical protein